MTHFKESIDQVYDNREKFILIGLTGRTGSGCSTTAFILSSEIAAVKLPKPNQCLDDPNEDRKYGIIYKYAMNNWKQFNWIKIKDIITSYILEVNIEEFADYIFREVIKKASTTSDAKKTLLSSCEAEYNRLRNEMSTLTVNGWDEIKIEKYEEAYKLIFEDLRRFSDKLKRTLNEISEDNYTHVYQVIGNNIRSSGSAISTEYKPNNIFSISTRVNHLIKLFRKKSKKDRESVFVVIDTLRNPFEALYFRERYSAFYLMAINTPDETRRIRLQKQHNLNESQITDIDNREYNNKKKKKDIFTSQDIQKCYDLADIHIHNPQIGVDDLTILKKQIAKFVTLIMHPGLVVPTRVERCMQIAHTAKLNSGCMSRQVGAVVTDKFYSIKAIGWNTSAEGQTPCMLRNVIDLINCEDGSAYSAYEKNDNIFRSKILEVYSTIDSKPLCNRLKGRNVPYCFKDIKNSIDGHKNQVHTRSLHAEENAFCSLQNMAEKASWEEFYSLHLAHANYVQRKLINLELKQYTILILIQAYLISILFP